MHGEAQSGPHNGSRIKQYFPNEIAVYPSILCIGFCDDGIGLLGYLSDTLSGDPILSPSYVLPALCVSSEVKSDALSSRLIEDIIAIISSPTCVKQYTFDDMAVYLTRVYRRRDQFMMEMVFGGYL